MNINEWITRLSKSVLDTLNSITTNLPRIHERLKDQNDSINTQYERSRQDRDIQPVWVDKIFATHEKSEQNKSTSDERHYSVQKSIRWATWVTAIAAVIYGGVATFQWKEARQTRITSTRAWIGVDRPIEITSLTGDVKQSRKISYIVTYKNFGPSPAVWIAFWSQPVSGYDLMKKTMNDNCFRGRALSRGKFENGNLQFELPMDLSPGTLFPGDTQGRHVTDALIDVGKVPSPVMVLGCLVYRDQFGNERTTKFCYGGQADPVNPSPENPAFFYECMLGENNAD